MNLKNLLLLLVPAVASADPVTARFIARDGDEYVVQVQQAGRQQVCPSAVTPAQPCELQLEKGEATVVATGAPSFEFDYDHQTSTQHTLAFRRTWPKWVGAGLLVAAIASFGLGGLYQARCPGSTPTDKVQCDSAYVGFVLGGALAALGLPAFIWGLFTGNRTVSEPLR